MANRGDEKRNEQNEDMPRGSSDEQIRGVANDEDDEFDDVTEDVDEEEEENEEGSF